MITLYRYDEMRECEDILHILPIRSNAADGHAQRMAKSQPYATARLPIPLTPCLLTAAARGYTTGFATPAATYMQYIKYNNKRYRYVSSYLKIDYTDYLQTNFKQARPRMPYIYIEHYYTQDLQHLLQPT